jgi:hypothetical protein
MSFFDDQEDDWFANDCKEALCGSKTEEAINAWNTRPLETELYEALKEAAWLYDQLALSPLSAAVKYGDNYEPPTDEDCLRIRGQINDALAKAEGRQ